MLIGGVSTPSAHALVEVPTLRFGLGMMPLKFKAGTITAVEGESLGNFLTLNPMFLWDISTLRARVGFHFQADLGSQYGFISTAGIGLTFIYYPTGLSSVRDRRDDGSIVIKTKVSPFIQFAVTPTRFAITMKPKDPEDPIYNQPSQWPYFTSNVIETSVGAGVDYPFNESLVGFAGLHYRFAALSSEETKTGSLKYNGMGLMIGVMSSFF